MVALNLRSVFGGDIWNFTPWLFSVKLLCVEESIMKCILGEKCNCIKNINGVCHGQPVPENLCCGTICQAIQVRGDR